jgi:hypothetical protein
MKRIFIMLWMLTGIAGPATHAEEQPAGSSDPVTRTDDATPDTDGSKEAPGKGKEQDEKEPDCE